MSSFRRLNQIEVVVLNDASGRERTPYSGLPCKENRDPKAMARAWKVRCPETRSMTAAKTSCKG